MADSTVCVLVPAGPEHLDDSHAGRNPRVRPSRRLCEPALASVFGSCHSGRACVLCGGCAVTRTSFMSSVAARFSELRPPLWLGTAG